MKYYLNLENHREHKKIMTPLEKYNYFADLHNPGNCFIMANAWDAGSAAILQQAGIKASGTASAGMAYSHALPDSQGV
jgi:2-methylisocitrate lyase-like PEP mutase family enzyme